MQMRRQTIALVAAAALLCAPAAAHAGEGRTIIERCAYNKSLSGFSLKGYREALKQLPTVGLEYSPCEEEIRQAELAAIGGRGAGIGGALGGAAGGAAAVPLPLTPAEQHEVLRAQHHAPAPVLLGKTPIEPGVVRADVASAASALPTSLLAVLALLLAVLLGFSTVKAIERVRARRSR